MILFLMIKPHVSLCDFLFLDLYVLYSLLVLKFSLIQLVSNL